MNLTNQSFLKIIDLTPEELNYLIELSADLKAKKAGVPRDLLKAKNTALILDIT